MKRRAKIIVFGLQMPEFEHAASALKNQGYETLFFSHAGQVLAAVRSEKADIVLLDMAINEFQGAEIIREAKAGNDEVSVILAGSEQDIASNPHMLMFAGYECIRKPIGVDLLLAVVEQKLNQQHLYRVCSAVSITREVPEILRVLLESLVDEVGADNGAILLKDDESDAMYVRAGCGLADGILNTQCTVDESDVLSLVMTNNEPIVLQGGFIQLPFLAGRRPRDISSSICAPLRIGGRTLGLLSVNRMETESPFSLSELRMAEIVALQAAVAIQNARAHQHALERQKLQHELLLARSIQQSLLPKLYHIGEALEVEIKSVPAFYIGGDFCDFIKFSDHRFGLAIGDVAGKGVPGAMMMMRTLSNFRTRARPDIPPAAVLEALNNDLLKGSTRGMYATVLYAILDLRQKTLSFANAGHPPPFLRNNRSRKIDAPDSNVGIPLGIMSDTVYMSENVEIEPGDVFFLYTDGIIEARNRQCQEFSSTRLRRLIEDGPAGAVECADAVLREVTRFTDGLPQHDDLTLLAIRPTNGNGN